MFLFCSHESTASGPAARRHRGKIACCPHRRCSRCGGRTRSSHSRRAKSCAPSSVQPGCLNRRGIATQRSREANVACAAENASSRRPENRTRTLGSLRTTRKSYGSRRSKSTWSPPARYARINNQRKLNRASGRPAPRNAPVLGLPGPPCRNINGRSRRSHILYGFLPSCWALRQPTSHRILRYIPGLVFRHANPGAHHSSADRPGPCRPAIARRALAIVSVKALLLY
jgi:hypothetical protein